MIQNFDLNRPLFTVTDAPDYWRIRDACEGVQIFGALGSGKTSGSGKVIAKAFLHAGFGGLVLTAKKDERSLWERYAAEFGRSGDLVIFSPENGSQFNFLQYEMERTGAGARDTENVVDLFFYVLEASGKQSGQSRDDPFWTHSLKQLLRNAIDLVYAAKGTLGLQDIKDVIKSAPYSRDEALSTAWREHSFCFQCIQDADGKERAPDRQRDFEESVDYWLETFPTLADRTRSIIVVMFSSLADYFLRGKLHSLFCAGINIRPEDTAQGKIIILDLPVREYGDRGRFAQILFKFMWQQATERRSVSENPRPVFLWADEAQNFATSYDMHFQDTARSSRACTVYLTQNLPNYYAVMGSGERGKHATDALLGNLQTKIFHANTDPVTNQWAAEIIGKNWQERDTSNVTMQQNQGFQIPFLTAPTNQSGSFGTSEILEYEVLPRVFTLLRKGGDDNEGFVDAVMIQGGRIWKANNKSYVLRAFRQDGYK